MKEKELEYIREDWDQDDIKVFNADKNLVVSFTTMGMDDPWLCVSCLNDQVSTLVLQLLQEDFEFAEFPHVQETLSVPNEVIDSPGVYRLEAVTVSAPDDETNTFINTCFSLYFGDNDEMVVAKALCSYQNGGMNSVGPTLEMYKVFLLHKI